MLTGNYLLLMSSIVLIPQLTYEGFIDETYGIENSQLCVSVTVASLPSIDLIEVVSELITGTQTTGKTVKISLTSADPVVLYVLRLFVSHL